MSRGIVPWLEIGGVLGENQGNLFLKFNSILYKTTQEKYNYQANRPSQAYRYERTVIYPVIF